jgi:hypothetical protein
MVHGPADGLHGLAEDGPSDVSFFFLFFPPFLPYIIPIFFYFYILLRRHLTLRFIA